MLMIGLSGDSLPNSGSNLSQVWSKAGHDLWKKIRRPSSLPMPARLTEHMEHVLVPIPGRNTIFKPNEADCVVCSEQSTGSRHRTNWMCDHCSVPLCVHPCFARHHTMENPYHICGNDEGYHRHKMVPVEERPQGRGPKWTVASWPFLNPTILGHALYWVTKESSKQEAWE